MPHRSALVDALVDAADRNCCTRCTLPAGCSAQSASAHGERVKSDAADISCSLMPDVADIRGGQGAWMLQTTDATPLRPGRSQVAPQDKLGWEV
jgi:hypothetical protein